MAQSLAVAKYHQEKKKKKSEASLKTIDPSTYVYVGDGRRRLKRPRQ